MCVGRVLVTVSCLSFGGCLELVLRQPQMPTKPPVENIVPSITDQEQASDYEPQPSATAEEPPVAHSDTEVRDVQTVNEYALWCIDKGMWKEAQLHLEQALKRYEKSASIHNNLGVVYESLGNTEEAIAAYARAREINPAKEVYLLNSQRLEQWRQRSAVDSTSFEKESQELDLFAPPRRSSQPYRAVGG